MKKYFILVILVGLVAGLSLKVWYPLFNHGVSYGNVAELSYTKITSKEWQALTKDNKDFLERKAIMEQLLRARILDKLLKDNKVKVDESRMSRALNAFKFECCEGSEKAWQDYLAARGWKEKDARLYAGVEIMYNALSDSKVTLKTPADTMSRDELYSWYKTNIDLFTSPAHRTVFIISVPLQDKRAFERAKTIQTKLKKDKKYRPKDEDLILEETDIQKSYPYTDIFDTSTGQVANKILKTPSHYQIVLMQDDIQPEIISPFDPEDVKTAIRNQAEDHDLNRVNKLIFDEFDKVKFARGYEKYKPGKIKL